MKKMPLQFLKVVALILLATPSAQAVSVKADPIAAKGCLPPVTLAAARAVIKRFNLNAENARFAEVRTLGTALTWIEKLNEGRPLSRAVRNQTYSYNFQSHIGNSHQDTNETRLNRNGPKNYGENVAQLSHELGHLIGNSDDKGEPNPDNNMYIDYINFVGPRACRVSTYAGSNSHEQFAEVFSAFVTRPDFIKSNPSTACQKAYEFLSTKLFPATSRAVAGRCIAHQAALLKRAKAMGVKAVTSATEPSPLAPSNAK